MSRGVDDGGVINEAAELALEEELKVCAGSNTPGQRVVSQYSKPSMSFRLLELLSSKLGYENQTRVFFCVLVKFHYHCLHEVH